jgi:hypothetical protein
VNNDKNREKTFRSFEAQVFPEVNRRGIAALGMKSLGGSGEMVTRGMITPEEPCVMR